MDRMRLSMVSMNFRVGDIGGNLDRIVHTMTDLASDDVDLVCCPELSLTGYSTEHSQGLALAIDDPTVMSIVDATSDMGIAVCFGFVEEGRYIT